MREWAGEFCRSEWDGWGCSAVLGGGFVWTTGGSAAVTTAAPVVAAGALAVGGPYVAYKYIAPQTTVPQGYIVGSLWGLLYYGDASELSDEELDQRIREVEDEVNEAQQTIKEIEEEVNGYGRHDVSGSLQNLRVLMRQLAEYQADKNSRGGAPRLEGGGGGR